MRAQRCIRQLLQVAVVCILLTWIAAAQQRPAFPSYDGAGNNIQNRTWGAANTPMIRYPIAVNGYEDNSSVMPGATRPLPRNISRVLMASPYIKNMSTYRSTSLLTVIGQYATFDISKALTINTTAGNSTTISAAPLHQNASNVSSVPITTSVPALGPDPFMSNFTAPGSVSQLGTRHSMPFIRSQNKVINGVRQPMNSATAFLDASTVYGTSEDTARNLRQGTEGQLRHDGQRGLPYNDQQPLGPNGVTYKLTNVSNDAKAVPESRLRAAGFKAINQHPGALALGTIWLREHNRRAKEFVDQNPSANDEEAFQYARKWVMAHFAHTILDEYLPVLLGWEALPAYTGYNATVDPSIDNFFSTAAYRYGHSTVTDVVLRLDENWQEHPQGHLQLSDVWFQPDKSLSAGIEPLLRGYVSSPQGMIEPRFSSAVQNNLFGPSNMNGTDLFAINIQRGRDHGLPDYNTCRKSFGLAPVTSFDNITTDPDLAQALSDLYKGNLSNIDAYVGGLSETHFGTAHVGELFYHSIVDQFKRIRDGDWWYYKNKGNGLFNDTEIAEIDRTGLREIIQRNTINMTELPDSIWQLSDGPLLGTCPMSGESNGLRGGASSNVAGPFTLLGGDIQLTLSGTQDPDWVKVQVVGQFDQGFVGFGVARPDASPNNRMTGADMVIGRMMNGAASVLSYHAPPTHAVPIQNTPNNGGTNNIRAVLFERVNGQTRLEFERPYKAADGNGTNIAIVPDGTNTFIVSHGQTDALVYHGINNRASIQVPSNLFGSSVSGIREYSVSTADALQIRTIHGTFMAVAFILVFPLGALMARQLRSRWIASQGVKALLFYLHIGTQMVGVALMTAGFVIATTRFNVPYQDVLVHHGQIGTAVFVLTYLQLLLGFVRPPAVAARARHAWQPLHALFGRAALLLGVVNVFIGVYILHTLYYTDIGLWGGLCAAGIAGVALLQYSIDLRERQATEAMAVTLHDLPATQWPQQPPPDGALNLKNGTGGLTNRLSDGFTAVESGEVFGDDIKDTSGTSGSSPFVKGCGPGTGGMGGQKVNMDKIFDNHGGQDTAATGDYDQQGGVKGPMQQQQQRLYAGGPAAAEHGGFYTDGLPEGPMAGFNKVGRTLSKTFSNMAPGFWRPHGRNDEPVTSPRLNPESAAALDPCATPFCDFESAGVYDPTSGAFEAAKCTKKPTVQEFRVPSMPPNLDNAAAAMGYSRGGPMVPRKYSGGSIKSCRSDISSGSGSNWRAAAAAAAPAHRRPPAAMGGGRAGSGVEAQLATAKRLNADAAAPPTAAGGNRPFAPPGSQTGTSTSGSSSGSSAVKLSSQALAMHNASPLLPSAMSPVQEQEGSVEGGSAVNGGSAAAAPPLTKPMSVAVETGSTFVPQNGY